MNTLSRFFAASLLLLPLSARGQVNSGSNGSDGAFNPTQSVEIDMADHPDGIYHYTSVNIPPGVTVTFKPNAANTPVVWLLQGDCVINGTVNVAGNANSGAVGGVGGPGGYGGGSAASPNSQAGEGPGGGSGGNFAQISWTNWGSIAVAGSYSYGNSYLLPLLGGSGGGGMVYSDYRPGLSGNWGGGGGGGAILVASSRDIVINGVITSIGGASPYAGGSGGGIRLVATELSGTGSVNASGGRVRFDMLHSIFAGPISGAFTQGFQPIILPVPNQGIQLNLASIGGVQVGANPSGVLVDPDVIIPALQTNPLNVVVNCTNVPLNTDIIIKVHPANGTDVTAAGKNTAGTLAASTATIPLNMPKGGGIIYASAVTSIAGASSATDGKEERVRNLAKTGLTADGETFIAMEITAGMGGKQGVSYVTESGKRYALPSL